jgi:hypothetical protein
MEAKQLMQYKFWLACGLVVLIELGLILFLSPTNENGQTPVAVKDKLDSDYKKLEDLYQRAGREPKEVFDVEDPKDIDKLTKLYLLTPQWKKVMQPHVDQYNKQLEAIKQDLVTRSKILHEPIADSGDLYAWYTQYENMTKGSLINMRNAGAIVIDPETKEDNDFEKGAAIRARVGFFTKGEEVTPKEEHPQLTTRFRIIEKLSQAIMKGRSSSVVNPIIKGGKGPEFSSEKCAAITGVEWKENNKPEESLTNEVGRYANAYELTISLAGSASTLIAAEGEIEAIAEPVMVVVGSTLKARGSLAAGMRKNVTDEPMTMRMTLAVIDFTKINTADSISSEAPSRPKASPAEPSGSPAEPEKEGVEQ